MVFERFAVEIVIVVVLKGTDVDVGGVRSENDLALYEVLVLIWLL